ncbi:dienelactone hydrolase family protein [Paraburkholderia sp. RL17-347-BIC-D]|uniref:dienelactone hydrolase family protein n=1 Tax=Paraburkholderia sp. RL17-347-BIC-D TaxID=3031632 RepID=UPI0038B6C8E0
MTESRWSDIVGSQISLCAKDGFELSAYKAGPEVSMYGLVIVQEIFGVNAHIREVADRFAKRGYKVVAPAMFDRIERGVDMGYSEEERMKGRAYRGRMTDSATIADIEAAADALGTSRCGIVGYSLGAYVAWLAATRTRIFQAACGWYGGGMVALRDEKPNCPVLLHFGDQDASVPMADVDALRGARPEVEICVYPGAKHGFGCDARPAGFSPADYDLAQGRTLTFLDRHLG